VIVSQPQPQATPDLNELACDPGRAQALSADERGRVMLTIAAILTALGASTATPERSCTGDRLLKIADAAAKLSVSTDYLYRHADKLPFSVRDGRRLRFSERGIEAWIARRRGFRKP